MYAPIPFFSPALGESAQNSEPTISINHKSNNFTIGWNLRSPNVVISGSTSDWKNRNLMLSAWVCQDAQTRSEVLLSSTQDLWSERQEWHLKNLSIFYIDREIVYTINGTCIKNQKKRPPVFRNVQAGTLRHDHCRGTWSGATVQDIPKMVNG